MGKMPIKHPHPQGLTDEHLSPTLAQALYLASAKDRAKCRAGRRVWSLCPGEQVHLGSFPGDIFEDIWDDAGKSSLCRMQK